MYFRKVFLFLSVCLSPQLLIITEQSSIQQNSKCFEERFAFLEQKINKFSNELTDIRQEIGHLTQGISSLMGHFKIKSAPMNEIKNKWNIKMKKSDSLQDVKSPSEYPSRKNSSNCPEDGVWVGGQCLAYFEQNVNWTTARRNCQDLGGDLAVPNNIKAFLNWISNWERLKKDTKYSIFLPAPWVGAKFGDRFVNIYGKRTYVGRAWQWINGEHLSVDDPNWFYERPKYEKQRCVSLNDNSRPEGPDFKLYEELCDEKLTYICEL